MFSFMCAKRVRGVCVSMQCSPIDAWLLFMKKTLQNDLSHYHSGFRALQVTREFNFGLTASEEKAMCDARMHSPAVAAKIYWRTSKIKSVFVCVCA